IEDAANRASSLTRQLLAFSRRQILRPKQVNVNEMVKNLERMISRLITEDISIHHYLFAEPDTVWVDPGQLEQVIMNLTVNARDALPDGGTINIKTENCILKEAVPSPMGNIPPDEYVSLSVQDSGVGIAPHHIKMIFEPFFTTKEEEKGTGLGLSTVYGIVKQSNGFIQVNSEPNRGTTFRIYLPLTSVPPTDNEDKHTAQSNLSGDERVMVVEDEENLRLLARRILELYGYKVILAGAPEEALEMAEDKNTQIDVLITDMVMPNIGGRELANKFRSLRPDVKIIYMSGYPQRDNIMSNSIQIDEEFHPFIAKPFSPEQFVRIVRQVLDSHEEPLV
ncbi:MAG: ATP-binding protein, partial [Sediminispirochaetaceae bacterium]